jgi:FHS family L-fucose permease-like MFS transporter
VVAIFVYVGAEVAIGSFLVAFLTEPYIGSSGLYAQLWSLLNPDVALAEATADAREAFAGRLLSLYWGGAMVGRFAGAALMRVVAPQRLLVAFAVLAVVMVGLAVGTTGGAAMVAVLSVGLFNSVMFPTIFSLAVAELGPQTTKGSGLLCMAIVGGAVVPLVQGALADAVGLQLSFALPLVCYGYIVYYGVAGWRPQA